MPDLEATFITPAHSGPNIVPLAQWSHMTLKVSLVCFLLEIPCKTHCPHNSVEMSENTEVRERSESESSKAPQTGAFGCVYISSELPLG